MDAFEIKEYLEQHSTEVEVQRLVQSLSDQRVAKVIDRWKEETMPKLIEEKLEELKKPTPESLQKQFSLKERAYKFSFENGVAPEVAMRHLGLDEEETDKNLSVLAGEVEKIRISAVEGILKTHGQNPRESSLPVGRVSREDLKRMDPAKVNEMFRSGRLEHLLKGES